MDTKALEALDKDELADLIAAAEKRRQFLIEKEQEAVRKKVAEMKAKQAEEIRQMLLDAGLPEETRRRKKPGRKPGVKVAHKIMKRVS